MEIKWHYLGLLAVVLTYVSVTVIVFHHVYFIQPTPFIDEAFHIPQAQQFCDGNYTEWDDKITTLPGLYLLSVGTLGYVSGFQPPTCTVYSLRLVNLIFSAAIPMTVYSIVKVLHADVDVPEWHHLLTSFSLAGFPLLYNYVFLYYTDVVSTLCVLLMYSLYIHKWSTASAVIGAVSVLVRQNNVVWVALLAGISSTDRLMSLILARMPISKRKTYNVCSPRVLKDAKALFASHVSSVNLFALAEKISDVISEGVQHGLVCIAFVAFVFWNGSLVVGDRSAHQAQSNPAQLVYFLAVTGSLMAPGLLANGRQVVGSFSRRPLLWALVAGVCLLLLESAPPAHLYLLSDNRHLSFYLWRHLFGVNPQRLVLAPLATITLAHISTACRHCTFFLLLGLATACTLVLASTGLFELRYFILPFLLLRLHCRPSGALASLLEFLLFFCVNAATLTLFTLKTFTWQDQPGLQRIIW